ncbi:uncharacterized protein [Euwallacea fornicatus]|uniref:uncharacterized protein isoform X2 n=1 Tax=Euwallacea fornicatus TaxID=995702 RepID=UPI00338E3CA2
MNSRKQAKPKRLHLKTSNNQCEKHLRFPRSSSELKSNVISTKFTLVPGFVSKGFASDTLIKEESPKKIATSSDNSTSESIQEFLETKRVRRSQRLQNKRSRKLKDATNTIHNESKTNLKSFQQENKSKSIFMGINAAFAKLESESQITPIIGNNYCGNLELTQGQNVDKSYIFKEASQPMLLSSESLRLNVARDPSEPNKNSKLLDFFNFLKHNAPNKGKPRTNEKSNRFFCSDFSNKICVILKRDVVGACRKQIYEKIKSTNLVMAGKISNTKKDIGNSDVEDYENLVENLLPIPRGSWVYATPRNRRMVIEQPQKKDRYPLEPGVIFETGNSRNLYEVKDKRKTVECLDENVQDALEETSTYFRKLAAVRKIPRCDTSTTECCERQKSCDDFKFGKIPILHLLKTTVALKYVDPNRMIKSKIFLITVSFSILPARNQICSISGNLLM